MTKNEPYSEEDMSLLCRALLSVEGEEECRALLEDLLTIKELQDLTQRMAVARLLWQGKGYQEIRDQVSVSTTTISRVSRALRYGAGGYRLALERLGIEREEAGE